MSIKEESFNRITHGKTLTVVKSAQFLYQSMGMGKLALTASLLMISEGDIMVWEKMKPQIGCHELLRPRFGTKFDKC